MRLLHSEKWELLGLIFIVNLILTHLGAVPYSHYYNKCGIGSKSGFFGHLLKLGFPRS